MRFSTHIKVKREEFLIDLLARHTDLSKSCLKDCMNKGAVWLSRLRSKERRLRKAKFSVRNGDKISIYYDDSILAVVPPQPDCVAMEPRYSIWNKPANLLTQGSRYGDHCSLLRFVEKSNPHLTIRLIHRLDREASGLVLLAHDKAAAAALSKLFQERQIEKCYHANAHGIVGAENKIRHITDHLDGKSAETIVKVVEVDGAQKISLLDIEIKTGRFHQIRRHLSLIGHPLVGDRKYGGKVPSVKGSPLQLTAYSLSFRCPFSGETRCYTLTE